MAVSINKRSSKILKFFGFKEYEVEHISRNEGIIIKSYMKYANGIATDPIGLNVILSVEVILENTEMLEWLKNDIKGYYRTEYIDNRVYFFFTRPEAAILFRLRWC